VVLDQIDGRDLAYRLAAIAREQASEQASEAADTLYIRSASRPGPFGRATMDARLWRVLHPDYRASENETRRVELALRWALSGREAMECSFDYEDLVAARQKAVQDALAVLNYLIGIPVHEVTWCDPDGPMVRWPEDEGHGAAIETAQSLLLDMMALGEVLARRNY